MTWLAVVAVVLSVIGAFYYLRIVKLMYFDDPQDTSPDRSGSPMRFMLSSQRARGAGAGDFSGECSSGSASMCYRKALEVLNL